MISQYRPTAELHRLQVKSSLYHSYARWAAAADQMCRCKHVKVASKDNYKCSLVLYFVALLYKGWCFLVYACPGEPISGVILLHSATWLLLFWKSLSLWKMSTTTDLATYMLKMSSYSNTNLVANGMNLNKQATRHYFAEVLSRNPGFSAV